VPESPSVSLPEAGATYFAANCSDIVRVFRAPGRVNLIGEHTDYNDGLVMPAAIDRFTWIGMSPRRDGMLAVKSFDLPGERTIDLSKPIAPAGDWTDYAIGVAWALRKRGVEVRGATLAAYSQVPLGAGLSSSAALEVAVAVALLAATATSIDRAAVAEACQHAENAFVGARCGIMDQFAVVFGRQRHCVRLDCRSLAFEEIPLPDSLRLVICDTMTRHAHASGGYNRRREECSEAVTRLQAVMPALTSLRDLSWRDFEAHRHVLSELLARRVRHVLSENDRVIRAASALRARDLTTVGDCMAASHESLRAHYEVTTPELDLMVALARQQRGVHGARMTGGGFGGSTINLVTTAAADSFADAMREAYQRETGVVPDILVCAAADGAAPALVGA
jgi:galactokinase